MHRIDSARQSASSQCAALAAQIEVLTDAINECEAMKQQFIDRIDALPDVLYLQVLCNLSMKRLANLMRHNFVVESL